MVESKAWALRVADRGLIPNFARLSDVSDRNIGTVVATLTGAWVKC